MWIIKKQDSSGCDGCSCEVRQPSDFVPPKVGTRHRPGLSLAKNGQNRQAKGMQSGLVSFPRSPRASCREKSSRELCRLWGWREDARLRIKDMACRNSKQEKKVIL